MENILIPPAEKGKQTDLHESITLPGREQALDTFRRASKRMLNPQTWHKLSGWPSTDFRLSGQQGEDPHRLAEEGDYLRIDIPGPGSTAGDGFDWARVEVIDDRSDASAEEESIGMRVGVSAAPGKDKPGAAHFFESGATSTFIIERKGDTVTASYYGRNEKANTAAKKIGDRIRDSAVALGAMAGLSELQWSALIKAFLQEEIGG